MKIYCIAIAKAIAGKKSCNSAKQAKFSVEKAIFFENFIQIDVTGLFKVFQKFLRKICRKILLQKFSWKLFSDFLGKLFPGAPLIVFFIFFQKIIQMCMREFLQEFKKFLWKFFSGFCQIFGGKSSRTSCGNSCSSFFENASDYWCGNTSVLL